MNGIDPNSSYKLHRPSPCPSICLFPNVYLSVRASVFVHLFIFAFTCLSAYLYFLPVSLFSCLPGSPSLFAYLFVCSSPPSLQSNSAKLRRLPTPSEAPFLVLPASNAEQGTVLSFISLLKALEGCTGWASSGAKQNSRRIRLIPGNTREVLGWCGCLICGLLLCVLTLASWLCVSRHFCGVGCARIIRE